MLGIASESLAILGEVPNIRDLAELRDGIEFANGNGDFRCPAERSICLDLSDLVRTGAIPNLWSFATRASHLISFFVVDRSIISKFKSNVNN